MRDPLRVPGRTTPRRFARVRRGGAARRGTPGATPSRTPLVAYVVSRFPKLSETFVLFEILAVEQEGVPVEVYPLQRERAPMIHPEAQRLVERAHYAPLLSLAILRSQLHYLLRRPRVYLRTLFDLVRWNLGSARYLAGALAFFPKAVHFAQRMGRDGISHVHAHFASHPAAVAFVIHRLEGIPYSFTAHGSDLHRDRHMLRQKVAEARFVVPISEFNRRVILDECGDAHAAKLAVIHCGIDPAIFRPVPEQAGEAKHPLRLVCVGTLHEVKGQAVLIEACRLLAERAIEFRCDLVGDGPDREALERQARAAGRAGQVRFLGALTRTEVAARLRDADVAVVPSVPTRDGRREGIPVALMEAAATGRPVVASRLSGIPEAIEDGVQGLLVEPGDFRALADAIGTLAADPLLRTRLGAAARERMLREFDLATNARLLAAHFRRPPLGATEAT
ncbi:MAG: colanic acid biosynthesis glycosyltransferase WcaL [Myxococcales bacterium]|nr:MAG: colanic acid biosynthesis glycosyltransferase WcaL [Myxococcales bacterium]